jgi:hypothetical protein
MIISLTKDKKNTTLRLFMENKKNLFQRKRKKNIQMMFKLRLFSKRNFSEIYYLLESYTKGKFYQNQH